MSVLLLRLGSLLPSLLKGEELISASRNVEQMCWRELGYKKMPVFAGDLPNFLGRDGDGNQVELSMPKAPAVLAGCFEKIRRPSPVAGSRVATNLDSIARLLELTLFELRILSCYRLVDAERLAATPRDKRSSLPTLWIISEADRSFTTLLRPDEY
ncbi:MAG: hypothetical protein ACK4OE_08445 [Acidovorax sp.]